jgi:hypothetical protein
MAFHTSPAYVPGVTADNPRDTDATYAAWVERQMDDED